MESVKGECRTAYLAALKRPIGRFTRTGAADAHETGVVRQRIGEIVSWPITITLDGTRFCHRSLRRDDEILTVVIPDDGETGGTTRVHAP